MPAVLHEEIYVDRPNSYLVACSMNAWGISKAKYARYLGISKSYMNNKLTRGSFSIRDICILLYIAFPKKRNDLKVYLTLTDDWKRLEALRINEEGANQNAGSIA